MAPGPFVLLQHVRTEEGWEGWITPGGGLEAGETLEAAAVRELAEEVGLRDVSLGSPVWKRRHVFRWKGKLLDQREHFFLVLVEAPFEVAGAADPAVLAIEGVIGHTWWSLEDLEASGAQTAPRRLASLVRTLLEQGPPAEPIDIGV